QAPRIRQRIRSMSARRIGAAYARRFGNTGRWCYDWNSVGALAPRGEESRHMATETASTPGASEAPADVSARLTPADRAGLLRHMLLMRGIEERAMVLYRQGKVPGSFYDGFGQEAVSVGAAWAMA